MSGLIARNVRKPSGWFGGLVVRAMNTEHSGLTDWGLQHLSIEKQYTALDVGCGGGRTVGKLAVIATEGKVYGIDHSDESVTVSRWINRRLIRSGRVEIQRSSVSSLPFPDRMFELVTAVETHYFWPDICAGLREILRVLKPRGSLILVGEIYEGGRFDERNQKLREKMNLAYQSVNELAGLFSAAGYSDVQTFEEYDRGWFCAIGRRP